MHSQRLPAAIIFAALALPAQQKFTAAEYQHAEKFMGYNTTPLVYGAGIRPNWLPDERFWYRVTTADGAEFILVDPAKGTRAPAFDHVKLAAALSAASGRTIDASNLPFQTIEFTPDGQSVIVQAAGATAAISPAQTAPPKPAPPPRRQRWTRGTRRRRTRRIRRRRRPLPRRQKERLHPR